MFLSLATLSLSFCSFVCLYAFWSKSTCIKLEYTSIWTFGPAILSCYSIPLHGFNGLTCRSISEIIKTVAESSLYSITLKQASCETALEQSHSPEFLSRNVVRLIERISTPASLHEYTLGGMALLVPCV